MYANNALAQRSLLKMSKYMQTSSNSIEKWTDRNVVTQYKGWVLSLNCLFHVA